MEQKVIQVGAYPPPYGGVSVHVQRLAALLAALPGVQSNVLSFYGVAAAPAVHGAVRVQRLGSRVPKAVLQLLQAMHKIRPDIVHVHASALARLVLAGPLLLAAAPRGSTRLLTIHSGSFVDRYHNASSFSRWVLRRLFASFDRVVTVNEEQKATLVAEGIDRDRIRVVPAFLPPTQRSSDASEEVWDLRERKGWTLVSSGYALPYYGFHTIVDAVAALPESQRPGLVLAFYHQYDEAYVAALERAIQDAGIDAALLQDLSPEVFAGVLAAGTVYVRATDRDGDAVAIREAGFLGLQVLATDCVRRPEGCALFPTHSVPRLTALLARANTDAALGRLRAGKSDPIYDVYGDFLRPSPHQDVALSPSTSAS